jgi:hypothetical protein
MGRKKDERMENLVRLDIDYTKRKKKFPEIHTSKGNIIGWDKQAGQ